MSSLVGTAVHSYSLPCVKEAEAGVCDAFDAENTFIVDDSGVGSESVADRFICAVGFYYLADGANRELSAETKLLSHGVIAGGMERNLSECLFSKGGLANPVASLVEPLESFQKQGDLFRSR